MANDKKTGNKNTLKVETTEFMTSNEFDLTKPKYDLPSVSINNVRNDLQNVIDTMGPTSPLIIQTINSDADNEDSLSSFEAMKKSTRDEKISVVEDSQMTICNISELTDQSEIAHICSSRELLFSQCPHSENYEKNGSQIFENGFTDKCKSIKQAAFDRKSRFVNWLGTKNEKKECCKEKTCDFYKINIEPLTTNDKSPPRRLVFDLMDELPKADTKTIGTNTRKQIVQVANRQPAGGIHNHRVHLSGVNQKNGNRDVNMHTYFKGDNPTERVDIYYFDHGNSEYYRTTDSPPVIMTEYLAERTEHYTKRFWAQIFGTIHIGVSFVMSFILQLVRFILQAIIRPLTIGLIQLVSDYFIKPFLAVMFNGIVQPPMIFLYNFATSLRDLCEPLATSMGYFIREVSVMCKAIRLVQVDTTNKSVKPVCSK